MPKPRGYTEEIRDAICEAYLAGETPTMIANRMNMKVNSIASIIYRSGIPTRNGGMTKSGLQSRGKVKDLIIKHALIDQSVKQIASEVGCSESYARYTIGQCGLKWWP